MMGGYILLSVLATGWSSPTPLDQLTVNLNLDDSPKGYEEDVADVLNAKPIPGNLESLKVSVNNKLDEAINVKAKFNKFCDPNYQEITISKKEKKDLEVGMTSVMCKVTTLVVTTKNHGLCNLNTDGGKKFDVQLDAGQNCEIVKEEGGLECNEENPCKENDGDCDNDDECEDDLVCGSNNCAWGDGDDCCIEDPGSRKNLKVRIQNDLAEGIKVNVNFNEFCVPQEKEINIKKESSKKVKVKKTTNNCKVTELYVTSRHYECVLMTNGGKKFKVKINEHLQCKIVKTEGGLECNEENPCKENEGDCDNDDECEDDLVCGSNNCVWGDGDDCCIEDPESRKNLKVRIKNVLAEGIKVNVNFNEFCVPQEKEINIKKNSSKKVKVKKTTNNCKVTELYVTSGHYECALMTNGGKKFEVKLNEQHQCTIVKN